MTRKTLFERMVDEAQAKACGHVYRITRHEGRAGVLLSLDGGWGNLPYPDDATAVAAAAASAAGDRHVIERKTICARPRDELGDTDPSWLAA